MDDLFEDDGSKLGGMMGEMKGEIEILSDKIDKSTEKTLKAIEGKPSGIGYIKKFFYGILALLFISLGIYYRQNVWSFLTILWHIAIGSDKDSRFIRLIIRVIIFSIFFF